MNYWQQRIFDELQRHYDLYVPFIEAKMNLQIQRTFKVTKDKLISLYSQIEKGTNNPAVLYQYSHYYEVLNEINNESRRMGQKEISTLENGLTKMYENTSNIIYSQFSFKPIGHTKDISEIVNSLWCSDGLLFSDRIWKDTNLLTTKLEDGLIDAVIQGKSSKELASDISKIFDVEYSNAKRLTRTEMAHIQSQATIDRYDENGIEYVQFISADEGVCDECDSYNGIIYKIDEAPTIPVHPNCRCCYVPVLSQEIK